MIDLGYARRKFEMLITPTRLSIPVEYENVPDSPDLATAKTNRTSWARVSIRQGEGIRGSAGTDGLRRYQGLVIVNFFAPVDTGSQTILQKATSLANDMVSASIDYMLIRTPYSTIVGAESDWFQVNLTIPYELDQITTS